jgi:hypothetical protein
MLYRATSGTFGGVLFAFAFLLVGQPSPFSIVVERGSPENGLITGKLSVNGHRIGTTYENQALKIPAGTYAGVLRYVSGRNFVSGPLGTIGTQGDFLLEVSGVSGRTDILFHGGNKPAQSQGCIMLGPVVPPPGSSIPSSVFTSKPAIEGHFKTGQRTASRTELVVPRQWPRRQEVS